MGIALGVLLVGLTLAASMFGGGGSVAAFAESISIFKSDCTTPPAPTDFTWGDTVCATVSGAPFPGQRRLAFVAPNGSVAQQTNITSDPQSIKFSLDIPVGDQFRQPGTWSVKTINNDAEGVASATFVVHDSVPKADLAIIKSGPSAISAGSNVTYTVTVFNRGPDDAPDVTVADPPPSGTTFVSATGPSGPCPSSSCTISTLAANSSADFTYVYNVNANLPAETVISNTASVSSSIPDPRPIDNSSTAETTVVVSNTAPCTLNCPGNLSFDNDPSASNPCVKIVTFTTPTATGNCADQETGTTSPVSCSPPSGSDFPVGTTTVVCSNGGYTCDFSVTVRETRPAVQPTINCPNNMTVSEDAAGSGTATVTYSPSATGNCASVRCEPPSGSTFPAGTTIVNCTATDPSNQRDSCSFNVTVTSTTGGCTLTCPGDITLTAPETQCNAVVSFAPTTSGNCGTVSCNPPSGSTFQVGTTLVVCTSDQGPSCEFTVTVNAPAAPTITTCATDRTVTANSNCEAAIPNLVPEVVATGCNVIVSQSPTAGSIVGPGSVTVTITAENSAGEVQCTATVTVLTPTPPTTSSCPSDITRANDAGQCGAVVTYTDPTGSSDCSSVTVSCSPASGALFPIGATDVICTARDVSGNATSCTFKVTVNDTQGPTITCPANITHASDPDQCGAVINYASPTASDNCPGVNSSCTPASGTKFDVGTTTVTCTATDASGLSATCSFTVTINDSQAPKITCPSDIAVGTDPNSSTATVAYQPTVSDNCPGVVTVSCTPASGSHFVVGQTTVTCTATDAATPSNTSSCSFTVTVSDNLPPTITCPAGITKSNDANQCGAVAIYANPTVTDNQPGATFSCAPGSGSVFPVGVTTVTCTATDAVGNHSTCSFSVTVVDTQVPAVICPASITASNTAGQCSVNVNPGVPTAADNCPGVTVVGSRSDGLALAAAYPVGTTTITWTARDAAGNQASCTQTVVVNDTQAPTITMKTGQQMEFWPPNHQYQTVSVSDFVATASDNCSGNLTNNVVIASISSDEPDDASGGGDGNTTNDIVIAANCKTAQLRAERQGSGNGRVYTITFRVKDSAGNVTTSTAKVGVPKSQNNNNGPIDDGPDHTVNSSCP